MTKDDFPSVRLFTKNNKEPLPFVVKDDKEFTADNMKKFIR